jgi:hypothetical protein
MKGVVMLTAIAIAIMLAVASTASAQYEMNSNPDFVKYGTRPYTCTTPGGRKITCNQWEYPAKSGWKRFCTGTASPFSKLADAEGRRVDMESSVSGCAILFDNAWADTRNLAKRGRALQREQTRTLKPAEFSQKIQLQYKGIYLFRACMAFQPTISLYHASPEDQINQNGIKVMVKEWHQSFTTPKVHAVLPAKSTFGPSGNTINGGEFDLVIPNWAAMPPGDPSPGVSIGVQDALQATVTDNTNTAIYDGEIRPSWYIDGLDGHAGLKMSYHTQNAPVDGVWTCHEAYTYLQPGFYAIVAMVSPYLSAMGGGNYLADYDGYGGISHISLTFEEGL